MTDGSPSVSSHKVWVLFEARTVEAPLSSGSLKVPTTEGILEALGALPTALGHRSNSVETKVKWSHDVITVSRDLSPILVSALGADPEQAELHRLPICRANRTLLQVVNGATPGGARADLIEGISLQLGAKTGSNPLPLVIDDAFLIQWNAAHSAAVELRTAILVLRLGLAPDADGQVAVLDILRAVHFLSHDSRKPAIRWSPAAEAFRLSDLAGCLLRPFGLKVREASRLYTYTFAKLEEGADGADLATRLARHYDEKYQIESPVILHPFKNIWHATELEGACTIASGNVGIFSVADPANAVQAVYLPQVMAAYYEHLVLLRLASMASLSTGHRQQAGLRRLQEGHLLFRLSNSLPMVSQLSLHNDFYSSLGVALGIPLLSRKVAEDATAAARVLEDRARVVEARNREALEAKANKREQQAAILQGVLTGAVAFLTGAALIKEGGEIGEKIAHGNVPIWHISSLIVVLSAAALAGWLAAVRHRFEHGGGGHVDHRREEEEETTEATHIVLEAVAGGHGLGPSDVHR